MSFSYSLPVNGIFATPKDEIRFLLSDTIQSDFSLTDEEINYLYESLGEQLYLAASQGALQLSVSYAKEATISSKTVGDLSLSLSYMDTSAEYKHLASHLRLGKIGNSLNTFFVEKDAQFGIGQFDELRP